MEFFRVFLCPIRFIDGSDSSDLITSFFENFLDLLATRRWGNARPTVWFDRQSPAHGRYFFCCFEKFTSLIRLHQCKFRNFLLFFLGRLKRGFNLIMIFVIYILIVSCSATRSCKYCGKSTSWGSSFIKIHLEDWKLL